MRLYTGVSSRNQADGDYSSLETQRGRLEAYCKSQEGYSVYRVYEDGGYSADSLDRPALKEMLRDIWEGRLDCVLAYKIDRLTRTVKDFHQLMDLFDRNDFGTAFGALTPQELSEALQCVLKRVTVHPEKLDMEIFELEEFRPGSQNRSDWLPILDNTRTLVARNVSHSNQ